MEEGQELCKDCNNFIVEDGKASCDWGFFENVNIYKAIIYVPELFDCEEWENV